MKKIKLIVSIIFVLVFFASSISVSIIKNKEAYKIITGMISQVEDSYSKSILNTQSTEEFFKDDYLNRAYAVDYILSNNPNENLNNKSLKKIKKLMEVESIHVVDKNGVIVLSSNDDSIGLNLLEHKESCPFWNLSKGQDNDGEVVQLDAISIASKEEKIYVGVESSLDEYSFIQIGLDRSALDKLSGAYSIEWIIENTPTISERAIFIVNKYTGDLESITKNNDQDIVFEDVNNNREFLDKLYDLTNGDIVKINNKYRYIKTKIIDDYIIGSYIDAYGIYNTLVVDIIYLILIMVLAFLAVIGVVKICLKKYILKDIYSMEKSIKELIDGDYDIEFKAVNDTELRQISNVLNQWKDSYKYKTERMTRIMSAVNTHSAIFECIYGINKNFFSNNIKEILGLDNKTWEKIFKRPEDFENYINSINAKEGIVNINNKFLQIVSFKKEDMFYGIIIDKTDDEEIKSKMKKESETDPLTKLLNRNGLEHRMEYAFKENKEGVFIIFDLDNFKKVNDALGHPIGDDVLQIFSNCLTSLFRQSDIIARLGGDEFIVFINENLEKDNLSYKLNKILDEIRKGLNIYYKNYGLSTSIGVAYKNEENNTYEKLYSAADEALYKAKKLGKDRFYINDISKKEQ